jgi:hypothetical protein
MHWNTCAKSAMQQVAMQLTMRLTMLAVWSWFMRLCDAWPVCGAAALSVIKSYTNCMSLQPLYLLPNAQGCLSILLSSRQKGSSRQPFTSSRTDQQGTTEAPRLRAAVVELFYAWLVTAAFLLQVLIEGLGWFTAELHRPTWFGAAIVDDLHYTWWGSDNTPQQQNMGAGTCQWTGVRSMMAEMIQNDWILQAVVWHQFSIEVCGWSMGRADLSGKTYLVVGNHINEQQVWVCGLR